MDNPLLKYSAKEYFFKAALCHFIVDELNAKVSGLGPLVLQVQGSAWLLPRLQHQFPCTSSVLEEQQGTTAQSRVRAMANT